MFGYQITTGRPIASAMQMVVLTRRTLKAMGVVDAESGGRRAFTTRVLENRKNAEGYVFMKLDGGSQPQLQP